MMTEVLYFLWEVLPRIAAGITTVLFLSKLRGLVPKKTPLGSLPNIIRACR
jgi:hypothetical protein